jgi:hypothetical protein
MDCDMPLGPDIVERLNRARADLRMGVPVAFVAGGAGVLARSPDARHHRQAGRHAEGARL